MATGDFPPSAKGAAAGEAMCARLVPRDLALPRAGVLGDAVHGSNRRGAFLKQHQGTTDPKEKWARVKFRWLRHQYIAKRG